MRKLPSGTVTFLFTDVEGSTTLLHELGPERYAQALAEHRRILREAFARHGGVEVDTQGDAFFVAFPTAPGALTAAEESLAALDSGPIRVRIGIHTGTPHLAEEGYVGADVHRAARIAAAGHGGQVLVSASTASLVGTEALRDLGQHRLKDLSAPEQIYQLGGGEFPRLKSLHQTNLPVPATAFLGRERELSEVSALLAREDIRLLTLTGPGGTGKTRLALQAAAEASERYPDGVWWVALAPLRDPALVLETAAHALGAKDGLAEHISDKRLLLVFDNFEHVVAAADEVPGLLAACPHVELLVTSRELLAVPGEQAYAVPPLAPLEGLSLFLARARAADPSFEASEAVAELCARLEQLPLALELAAARVRVLSPEQLLERLSKRLDLLKAGRGVDPRQQTLRATIEWSHELLDEDEQRLFARLSVFAGGCTLEAAEQVCEADLDTLQSLVDKSLVRVRDGERFWMLETIREYAAEQLEARGEASAIRAEHVSAIRRLVEKLSPALRRGERGALDEMAMEHDNVRVALAWALDSGDAATAITVISRLAVYWTLQGHARETVPLAERAIAAAGSVPPMTRAAALAGASELHRFTGSLERAVDLKRESLDILRTSDDEFPDTQWTKEQAIVWLLKDIAQMLAEVGEHAHAEALASEAIALAEAAEDEYGAAHARLARGLVLFAGRKFAEARDVFTETLPIMARHDSLPDVALLHVMVGECARRLGALDDAVAALRRGIELVVATDDRYQMYEILQELAAIAARRGDPELAARLLGASERRRELLGAPMWDARDLEEQVAAVTRALGPEKFGTAWAAGRALADEDLVPLAFSVE